MGGWGVPDQGARDVAAGRRGDLAGGAAAALGEEAQEGLEVDGHVADPRAVHLLYIYIYIY